MREIFSLSAFFATHMRRGSSSPTRSWANASPRIPPRAPVGLADSFSNARSFNILVLAKRFRDEIQFFDLEHRSERLRFSNSHRGYGRGDDHGGRIRHLATDGPSPSGFRDDSHRARLAWRRRASFREPMCPMASAARATSGRVVAAANPVMRNPKTASCAS
jgi:hypothetical protein